MPRIPGFGLVGKTAAASGVIMSKGLQSLLPLRTMGLSAAVVGRMFPKSAPITANFIGKVATHPTFAKTFEKFVTETLVKSNPKLHKEIMAIVAKNGGSFSAKAVSEVLKNPKIMAQLSYQQKLWLAAELGGIASMGTFYENDVTFAIRTAEVFSILASDTYKRERSEGRSSLAILTKYMSDDVTKGGTEPVSRDELRLIINYLSAVDDIHVVNALRTRIHGNDVQVSDSDIRDSLKYVRTLIKEDTELNTLLSRELMDEVVADQKNVFENAWNYFFPSNKPNPSPLASIEAAHVDNSLSQEISHDKDGNLNTHAVDLRKLPYNDVLKVKSDFETLIQSLGFSKSQGIEFLRLFHEVNKFSAEQYAELYGFKK